MAGVELVAGMGLGKLLGVIAVIVIIVGVGAGAAIQYSNSSNISANPALLPETNETVLPQISAALNHSQGNVFYALANLSQQYVNSIPQTTVAYKGDLKAEVGQGGLSFLATFSSPVSIISAKYRGQNRFDFNLTDLAPYGNIMVSYANLTNGTSVCTNLNVSAIESTNIGAILGQDRGQVLCKHTNYVGGLNMTAVSNLEFTQIDQITNVNYTSYYQSEWNGMACTFINGTITPLNQSQNWDGVFQTCISNNYWIPLTMYIYLNDSQGRGHMSVNETSISSTANLTYITTPP
ncbi:MAG: hypothetical protein KGH66_01685 [Candidatus Micrarchaeota archaeon]|nr:hypothetical protein [Candidatus Micrarchaeota archaeon]